MATTTEELRSQVSRKIRLVTIRQLSAATGLTARSVWRRVQSGDLPKPFKFGGRAVWREADIEKVIRDAAGAADE
jgi:predicted DNA-binding transcriptional regulator AlpA